MELRRLESTSLEPGSEKYIGGETFFFLKIVR